MTKKEKISHGNIEAWKKKREAFFKTDPKCSDCGNKITHYTKTGMCPKCRAKKNINFFHSKNPGYHKKYNKVRVSLQREGGENIERD